MRYLKLIFGIGSFVAALLPASIALLVFSQLGGPETLLIFCWSLVLAILATSLICAGWFLIAQRNSRISRNARILLLLPFLCTAIFVVLVAMPNRIGPRRSGPAWNANGCINNLRQIDAAKNEWAVENKKTNGTAVTESDIKPYIKLDTNGNLPKCPSGGTYTIGKIGEPPTCSLGTTVSPPHVLP
ncbi:MAG TPA: hypothetical protein VN836_06035 [Verrucomicrobiae bacterium]|nr:hypothetical protein [Verrucomicrobiae bacterium]